jgi:hypothetical protein
MSIVSRFYWMKCQKRFWFKVLLDEMPENIQKWFLVNVEMPYMWNNVLCPVKIAHKSNACA